MITSDDSFIREVNEDIRQENIGHLWRKLKPFIIGSALSVILAVIAWQIYTHHKRNQAQHWGDSYAAALKLAEGGYSVAAFEALTAVENSRFGGYPVLASLRKAALLAQKGDVKAAVAVYDAVAADNRTQMPWGDMARIRAGYLLADSGSFVDVRERVAMLANDVNPLRSAAREALGLSAWKAGKLEEASYYFNRNAGDEAAAALGFSARALMMLSLISSESEITPPSEKQNTTADAASSGGNFSAEKVNIVNAPANTAGIAAAVGKDVIGKAAVGKSESTPESSKALLEAIQNSVKVKQTSAGKGSDSAIKSGEIHGYTVKKGDSAPQMQNTANFSAKSAQPASANAGRAESANSDDRTINSDVENSGKKPAVPLDTLIMQKQ